MSSPGCKAALLAAICLLVSCLSYFSTLKTEAVIYSETSINFYRTTWRYITGDRILRSHRCENLKSKMLMIYFLFLYGFMLDYVDGT
jgi:hypothetical protein